MVNRTSFIVIFFSLLSLFYFVGNCDAKRRSKHYCDPSSCGALRNISYPFRLTTDPSHCGDSRYELSCENNQTILYLFNGRYYVTSISYTNRTIRIVDPGLINPNNCSSLPLYSLTKTNFTFQEDPYDFNDWYASIPSNTSTENIFTTIAFVTCPFEVNADPDLYKDTSPCIINDGSPRRRTYVVPGELGISDLKDSCSVDVMVKIMIDDYIDICIPEYCYTFRNLSYAEIHRAMGRGVELTWYRVDCGHCLDRGGGCDPAPNGRTTCVAYYCLGRITIHCVWSNYKTDIIYWTKKVLKIIGFIMAGRTLCGILFLLALVVYKSHRRHLSFDEDIEKFLQDNNNHMPIRYSYSEIRSITQGFKSKLGQGGFGSVFKGTLRSGRFVAIKMLGKSKATGQEFINEVASIGRIHHINVVRLIGFCAEGEKRALVYDYMPNGSLEKYLFSQGENRISLSWEKMHDIALGVARGIEYLHHGCEMKILHFDIKPHNILLDKNFIPKVADFGLAKLYPIDNSIVTLTAARGTIGYIAPELFYKNIGGISYKSDIYSFGMLLMEMAGRRKNVNAYAEHSSEIYFPLWVYDRFTQGEDIEMEIVSEDEKNIVKKLAMVALWCIQMKPIDRPATMSKVLEMLEGDVDILQMPPKPFFSSPERTISTNQGGSTSGTELLSSYQSNSVSSSNSLESIPLVLDMD